MSKFKLTQTAAEVQNILNNSLQKPTGLAKTELVGVGVNGQENIEIGDNLTLANGKLSAAAAGGGKLYRHKIEIFSNQSNGIAVSTIYTSTEEEFTRQSFSKYIGDGSVAASGLFQYNGEYSTVLSLNAVNGPVSLTLFVPSINTTTKKTP